MSWQPEAEEVEAYRATASQISIQEAVEEAS